MEPIITTSVSLATPLIKKAIDQYITPKLNQLLKSGELKYKKYLIPIRTHFEEYLNRSYERFSIINTLIVNNRRKALKDIYIPLTISKQNLDGKDESYTINGYPKEIFEKYNNILITDTAGMGKSTLAKRVFIDIIDNGYGIPILIELRRLSKQKDIIAEILEQINSIKNDFDNKLFLELLGGDNFIFILDGYDEISITERDKVTADIQDFISKTKKNKFLLTSRPENALVSFGDFQGFKIKPLKKREAYNLLKKYDNNGLVSAKLVEKLEAPDSTPIKDFLQNPLLVSLLFIAFDFKQTLPLKKHIFYRQVYDANFETHDLTKGDSYIHEKYSKLDIDDFHRVLRYIGFACIRKQKIEFSKDEILQLIRSAKEFCKGIKFSESDFLADLLKTVPIFCKDGNYYKWAHKSLQEYFAAQFIYLDTKEQQQSILLQIYNSKNIDKYANLLDLYYDIDYNEFRNVILYEFLKEYCSKYTDLQQEAQNLTYTSKNERIYLLLLSEIFIVKDNREAGNFERILQKCKNCTFDTIHSLSVCPFSKKMSLFIFPVIKTTIIISLLASKKNQLIHTIRKDRNRNKSINIKFSTEINQVNLDPDNIANKDEKIFCYINDLIVSGPFSHNIIKFEDAINELKTIELDKVSKEKNSLLDGI